ncbi:MAG: hypothetical protein RDU20_19650 [Desulfomonilaceae bacterium]|nr:hypothetical protein [Desulfomonilaceae bacterium]
MNCSTPAALIAAAALHISGHADTYEKGMSVAKQALSKGLAAEKLAQLTSAQGGRSKGSGRAGIAFPRSARDCAPRNIVSALE